VNRPPVVSEAEWQPARDALLVNEKELTRTYYTTGRGVDRLRLDVNLMDLTPYGRQAEWEDSPEGWPQYPTGSRIEPCDEYEIGRP
jgi:predicted dithiol-disulfide oxidoreductase (DUF899 family)